VAVTRLDGKRGRKLQPHRRLPKHQTVSQFRVDESVRDGLARISGTLIQRL